jgi:hypothetical protein
MNKTKILLGILIAIAGGVVMITSMVFAIINFAGNLYEDIHVFNINLQTPSAPSITTGFSIKEEKDLSLWLKAPNRQIENKDFEIEVFLIEKNDSADTKFNEDFRFGYSRNSSGEGQYYKLGKHSFQSGFNGYFRYKTKGTWVPAFKGNLVLRQELTSSFPVKQMGFFVIGIFVLVVGIGTIAKNSKKQITNKDRLVDE